MKSSWKFTLFVFLLVSLCALFTSCATKPKTEYITITETEIQTVTETEYVPVYVDLTETIQTVVDQRPDNSKYSVNLKAKSTYDILVNSWTYQMAWCDWQAYAELLEDTLYICRDKCSDPATQTTEESAAAETTTDTTVEQTPTETTKKTVETDTNNKANFEVPTIG